MKIFIRVGMRPWHTQTPKLKTTQAVKVVFNDDFFYWIVTHIYLKMTRRQLVPGNASGLMELICHLSPTASSHEHY